MSRISFTILCLLHLAAAAPAVKAFGQPAAASRPNLLLITMDDLSCDSIGAFGCKLAGTSPNVDRLASQGLRFEHAHVQVGNCMPSRNVLISGRYPHNNRVEGFYQVPRPGYPVLPELLKSAGYYTAIRGKVPHSTPYSPHPGWDLVLDKLQGGGEPKNVASYGLVARHGLQEAKRAGKPFYLHINVSDPHKPFYGEGKGSRIANDPNVPSRVFTAAEVPMPGFLPDDPVIREELARYYSSVRRGDDCVGQILKALEDSGEQERTIVMFLSDHGMPLPFAKTQLYHHSTRTPWIVRWPGTIAAGRVDDRHMISAVDYLPTILELMGIEAPAGVDGRSFLPLLQGQTQAGREMVFKEYNENAGGNRSPMRAVQTRTHLYLFNPWSNGKRIMATATAGTPTFRRMKVLAESNPAIAARVELIQHRVLEEAYDIARDPDALTNLIDDPASRAQVDALRADLESWMKKTGDPMLDVFQKRSDASVREAYMAAVERDAAARTKRKRVGD